MEFVFVIPRTALFPECYPHGLVAFGVRRASAKLIEQSGEPGSAPTLAEVEAAVARDGFFVERAYAERTPSLKQLIPYSIIVCDGRVLLFQRLATGGEKRLHGKLSIGIGGHINPQDLDGAEGANRSPIAAGSATRSPIAAGTRREIAEELDVRGTFEVHTVGLLNDDSNPVGAVHAGVVQVVYVNGSVEIREREQLEGRLVTVEELASLLAGGANFETWSRLLVPRLDELLQLPIAAQT